jgi:hypothetical protein
MWSVGRTGARLAGPVIELSTGVIQATSLEKVRSLAIGVALILAAGGTSVALVPGIGQTPPPVVNPPPVGRTPAPGNDVQSEKGHFVTGGPSGGGPELDRQMEDAVDGLWSLRFGPPDDPMARLKRDRLQTARDEVSARLEGLKSGTTQGTIDLMLASVVKRLLPAELSLSDQPKDRLAAYERSLTMLKWIEAINKVRYRAGRISIQDLEQTQYERINLEIGVLEESRKVTR